MASIKVKKKDTSNGRAVALEEIDNVRKGKKVNMQEIQLKHGYSKWSAKAMKATETESYKETIKPFVDKMIIERDRTIEAVATKNLSKEKYRDMIDAIDKLTKNIQIMTGGKTGNEPIILSWE